VGPAPPPTWIRPQLAKLVEKAPDGPDWLHEMKLDGYRMHTRLDAGSVQILTRRGNDWTEKYPTIAKSIAGLPARNAYLEEARNITARPRRPSDIAIILCPARAPRQTRWATKARSISLMLPVTVDPNSMPWGGSMMPTLIWHVRVAESGELCGLLPDGRTSFNLIQNATDTGQGSLVFFLFDLLFLDGKNLTALPLVERKARLASLVDGAPDCLRYNDHQIGHGPAFHRLACEHGVKASSLSAPMAGTSPTGVHGLRSNA
jgi:ATP-dependent DNA ligase